ncbi:MAG: methionine--tRNA ligase subunit beta [Phycisphaeraceae bacterium]
MARRLRCPLRCDKLSARTNSNPTAGNAMDTKETITYDDFAKLDLRVATVTAAEAHPNADRLLKLQVDLGGEQRQICAGVKAFYDPASLVGRQIVVVANLAPRTIRGEESNGMLLAASAMDGEALKDVVLLAPSKDVPAGSSVG